MYNGWKNYETWNVALWFNNDESLYNLTKQCQDYADFKQQCRELGQIETPDGVAYNDSGLDEKALNNAIKENHA